jgi:RNA polymerase sigma-70 factor (ECF subfamily)
MGSRPEVDPLSGEWERHHRALWSLSYRMTGVAADADDVVQETFVRAMRDPPDRGRPVGPWLTKVAVNVARDLLRARKRRGYAGPWLPSPLAEGDDAIAEARSPTSGGLAQGAWDEGPEGRYGLLESTSFAFLLALETLTPMQRAVLVLRDVLDYSVRETADAVASTEGAVKVTHLRARRAMAGYDGARAEVGPKVREGHLAMLHRFLAAVGAGDAAAVEALLADDVVVMSDGGGEYKAALRPLHGPARAAAFMLGVARKRAPPQGFALAIHNGLPSVMVEAGPNPNRWAPRIFMQCPLDAEGRIARVYLVLASRKLVVGRAGLA